MIKVLLVIIVICGFVYVGFGISNYYKKREEFFAGLIILCDRVRADIDFSNKNLISIFQTLNFEGNLKKLVANYCEYLQNKDIDISAKHIFHGIWILKDEEKNVISDFFARLGRHDCDNEIKLIDDFKNIIEPMSQSASQDKSKYGKMSVKISFLLGLMVAILIV
ncbi:MAG: hypothetical protein ACI4T2_04255 [Christensenellales bacterium]